MIPWSIIQNNKEFGKETFIRIRIGWMKGATEVLCDQCCQDLPINDMDHMIRIRARYFNPMGCSNRI